MTLARFSRRSALSASGNQGSPTSFGGCSRTFDAEPSNARRRGEEALARAAPLTAPEATVGRGECLAERYGLTDAAHEIAGAGHADVLARQLEAVALAAAQLAHGIAIAAILDPLRRTVCAG